MSTIQEQIISLFNEQERQVIERYLALYRKEIGVRGGKAKAQKHPVTVEDKRLRWNEYMRKRRK